MNYYQDKINAKDRYQDFVREAEKDRLLLQSGSGDSVRLRGLGRRALSRFGCLLVGWSAQAQENHGRLVRSLSGLMYGFGRRLQARYAAPAATPC